MSAVVFEEVGKRYRQYRDEGMLLKRLFLPHKVREHHDIWALRDISFEVAPGDTLGIIGRNGSGKTTLLRLLSGVSAPTRGRVRVAGAVAPLIGVGVGFNPELTGRENVLVNGRLLGMTAEEVTHRYDRIVEFSEIEDFIDVPVKFYSSGMFLRLAFSVAIHTEPEVMAVDEILAVGDVGFQAKCFDRMRELQGSGTTIVVVTHNLQVLQRMASRTIVLDRGEMLMDGTTEEAIQTYHEVMARHQADRDLPTYIPEELGRRSKDWTATVAAELVTSDGDPTLQVRAGEPIRIRVEAEFDEDVSAPIVGVAIERVGLGILFAAANAPDGYRREHGPGRPLHAEVDLGNNPLLSGTYTLRTIVRSPREDAAIGASEPLMFHVTSDRPGAGSVDLDPRFSIEGHPVPTSRPWLLEATE